LISTINVVSAIVRIRSNSGNFQVFVERCSDRDAIHSPQFCMIRRAGSAAFIEKLRKDTEGKLILLRDFS
jgi:hypothetical protein